MELRPGADSLVMERGGVYNWLETQLYLWRIRLGLFTGKLHWFLGEVVAHPSALIGGVVMLLYVAMAVLAPRLAPWSPYSGELTARCTPAWISGNWQHILAAMKWGAICCPELSTAAESHRGLVGSGFLLVLGTTLGLVARLFSGASGQCAVAPERFAVGFPLSGVCYLCHGRHWAGYDQLDPGFEFQRLGGVLPVGTGAGASGENQGIRRSGPPQRPVGLGYFAPGDLAQYSAVPEFAGHLKIGP